MDATEDLKSTIDLTADSSSDDDDDDDDDVVITGMTAAPSVETTPSKEAEASQTDAGNGGRRSILIAEEMHASKHVDHNLATYNSMRAGDLVEFHRGLYTHWGVAIGDGKIMHLSGDDDDGLGCVKHKLKMTD